MKFCDHIKRASIIATANHPSGKQIGEQGDALTYKGHPPYVYRSRLEMEALLRRLDPVYAARKP